MASIHRMDRPKIGGNVESLSNKLKSKIRSWLEIQEMDGIKVSVLNGLDYESNALKNRIWYSGDSNELSELYKEMAVHRPIDSQKFWAAESTKGLEIQKRHTGIPGMIIDTLADIVLADFNGISFDAEEGSSSIWETIARDNDFDNLLEEAVKMTLCVGDGAFKISVDTDLTNSPIIEYWPGDQIEIVQKRGRIQELIFKSIYSCEAKKYELHEIYGYGYIKYELYYNEKQVPLSTITKTANLETVTFAGGELLENDEVLKRGAYMMALPIKFGRSGKWKCRGLSILDRKEDSFDSLDETWSQWMDAIRAGRTKQYIPETMIPRNEENGALIKPNPFDNRYIRTKADMTENADNKILVESPVIQHESYMASYITALDLCLQGIISPSTLGIDTKKLENAEAQREKEKTTLYTRQKIIGMITEVLPELVCTVLKVDAEMKESEGAYHEPRVNVKFGEYANPSFESQIETVGKGKQYNILSTEAAVDELYGDSKTEDWKHEEVRRLKEEQGIAVVEEPSVNIEGIDLIE